MQYKSETPLEDLILPVSYIERAKALCAEGMRKILAIAGAPGSGKSTVARLLRKPYQTVRFLFRWTVFIWQIKNWKDWVVKNVKGHRIHLM